MIVSRRKYLTGFQYKKWRISLILNSFGELVIVVCPNTIGGRFSLYRPWVSSLRMNSRYKFPKEVLDKIKTLVELYDPQ